MFCSSQGFLFCSNEQRGQQRHAGGPPERQERPISGPLCTGSSTSKSKFCQTTGDHDGSENNQWQCGKEVRFDQSAVFKFNRRRRQQWQTFCYCPTGQRFYVSIWISFFEKPFFLLDKQTLTNDWPMLFQVLFKQSSKKYRC